MGDNWKTYKFEELYAQPSRNGLTKPKRIRGEGFKMVNMGELFRYSFIGEQEMDRVPLNKAERSNYMLESGDILFARQSLVEAGVGKCSLVKKINEPTTFESHIIRVRPNASLADSAFLYYLFNSSSIRQILISMANGVAAFGIRGSELSMMELNLPPIQKQKEIASILTVIDDKIELNLQMNKTLEEMAMTLYKHWFVDFGPFQEGEFVESELGMIPKGWEVKRLDEVSSIKGGKRLPKGAPLQNIQNDHPYIRVRDFNSAYLCTSCMEYVPNEVFKSIKNYIVSTNDVVLTIVGTVGGVALIGEELNRASLTENCVKISSTSRNLISELIYLQLISVIGQDEIKSKTVGSTQPKLPIYNINSLKLVLPIDLNDIKNVSIELQNSFQMIHNNMIENQTLTTLRDTLLPKLISGEVRVKEAAEMMAEVM